MIKTPHGQPIPADQTYELIEEICGWEVCDVIDYEVLSPEWLRVSGALLHGALPGDSDSDSDATITEDGKDRSEKASQACAELAEVESRVAAGRRP